MDQEIAAGRGASLSVSGIGLLAEAISVRNTKSHAHGRLVASDTAIQSRVADTVVTLNMPDASSSCGTCRSPSPEIAQTIRQAVMMGVLHRRLAALEAMSGSIGVSPAVMGKGIASA